MLPLFNQKLPANAGIFFGVIMTIASFDVIPTDTIYDSYLSLKQDDPGPISQNFEALGYGSRYFIYNMGTLMIGIAYLPVLVALSYALKTLGR